MVSNLVRPMPLALTQLAHTSSGERFDLPSATFRNKDREEERKSEVHTIVDYVENSHSNKNGSSIGNDASPGALDPPTLCAE